MMPGTDEERELKQEILRGIAVASRKVAIRLAKSHDRCASIFPIQAASIDGLDDDDEERIDAFLLRFTSLVGMVQDQLTRSILEIEEEDISDASRKDKRLLMEKLGGFAPEHGLGAIAELRSRLAHVYPDDPEKQANILNSIFDRTPSLIDAFNHVVEYVNEKHLADDRKIDLVTEGSVHGGGEPLNGMDPVEVIEDIVSQSTLSGPRTW